MNILCTICTDLINPSDIINFTKCGHIFHHHCLAQWIQRSSSCPQCRQRVTPRCVVRAYPTLAQEGGPGDTAAALASRLDHSALQLRELRQELAERERRLAELHAEAGDAKSAMKVYEQKLVSAETAALALKEQVRALRVQARETDALRDQLQQLNSKMNILNGLQRVLSGTSEEVEQMLQQGYSDVRTVATFATALKRALCESESKKQETRRALEVVRGEVRDQRALAQQYYQRLLEAEETELRLKRQMDSLQAHGKRKAQQVEEAPPSSHDSVTAQAPCEPDVSLVSLVRRIESSESPYLQLRQSSAAHALKTHGKRKAEEAPPQAPREPGDGLGSLVRRESSEPPYLQLRQSSAAHALKPSELILLRGGGAGRSAGGGVSIFPHKRAAGVRPVPAPDAAYDGLGGHERPSPSPAPAPCRGLPHRTVRHRLRAPAAAPPTSATTPSAAFAALFQKRADGPREPPTATRAALSDKRDAT